MIPRPLKKGTGQGRNVAATSTAKQPVTAVKVEDLEAKKEMKVEDIVNTKLEEKSADGKAAANGSGTGEDDTNDILNEEDKYERLQLVDNCPQYECEEEIAVDYDEKMIDDNDDQEVDEEEIEVDTVEEEEGDLVDEEIEDGREDDEDGEEDVEDHANIERHEAAEEEEHHKIVKERRKRKEFEVFVGGLDKNATESDLREVFSEVGELTEIRLLRNSLTKKNKGFAFLRFATVEQAKCAVTELKNPVVKGKRCGVTPSEDNDTLFLGNICKTWTKEHLKETLKNYGVNNIENLTLVEDITKEGMNRGFAFLEFSSRSDAVDAYRCLRKKDVLLGVDQAAKVDFADSLTEPDDEIMSQVKTVFVDGIPPAWDEEQVKEHVKKFGRIEKIELARNMPAAKRRNFGFVTFDTHEAAITCVESIKIAGLGEGDNKVKIRARLSRPLQIGRGKHITREYFRAANLASRDSRPSWSCIPPHLRASRESIDWGASVGGHGALVRSHGPKTSIGFQVRRPTLTNFGRTRHLPPPVGSYGRRPLMDQPLYPESSSKRGYGMQGVPSSRSRAVNKHESRIITEGRSSFGHDYSAAGAYYDVLPRTFSRTADRRTCIDQECGRKTERPLPLYRVHGREYGSISGSKRLSPAMDDAHPDASMRQSRARLDYDVTDGAVHYEDRYGERLGRSHMGYSRTRSSLSEYDAHGTYGSRQGMSCRGPLSGSEVGRVHSSSGYDSSYLSRDSDIGSSSYSSTYSAHSLGSSGYLYGRGSESHY